MLGSSVLRGDLLAVAADGVALSESAMTKVAQPKKKRRCLSSRREYRQLLVDHERG
jgi:hypothetical protein